MTPALCEVRVFSRRHRFAGKLDLVGLWKGAGALIDYKTGRPADVAADLQTAAYLGAWLEMRAAGDTSDQLTFDPGQHAYTLDGVPLPSVTGVIRRAGLADFAAVPAHALEHARARGNIVHSAIQFFNDGDLDVAAFAADFPDCVGYLDAWRAFLVVSGCRFATPADLAGLTVIRRYAVQLRNDATFAVTPYTNPGDYATFLTLLHAQQIRGRRRLFDDVDTEVA